MEMDGQHWCAQRRIYPAQKVIEEIIEAGFNVIEMQVDAGAALEPSLLRAVVTTR